MTIDLNSLLNNWTNGFKEGEQASADKFRWVKTQDGVFYSDNLKGNTTRSKIFRHVLKRFDKFKRQVDENNASKVLTLKAMVVKAHEQYKKDHCLFYRIFFGGSERSAYKALRAQLDAINLAPKAEEKKPEDAIPEDIKPVEPEAKKEEKTEIRQSGEFKPVEPKKEEPKKESEVRKEEPKEPEVKKEEPKKEGKNAKRKRKIAEERKKHEESQVKKEEAKKEPEVKKEEAKKEPEVKKEEEKKEPEVKKEEAAKAESIEEKKKTEEEIKQLADLFTKLNRMKAGEIKDSKEYDAIKDQFYKFANKYNLPHANFFWEGDRSLSLKRIYNGFLGNFSGATVNAEEAAALVLKQIDALKAKS